MEECDLGPLNADEGGCTSSCRLSFCGDGFVEKGVEECDLGPNNANDGACTDDCKNATCGDGFVWKGVEGCDLGINNAADAECTPECTVAICGDGFLRPGEECDDGNPFGADGCGPTCLTPRSLQDGHRDNLITGEADGDFPFGLTNLGDLNGDGLDDLGIASGGHDPYGAAYILFDALEIGNLGEASIKISGTEFKSINGIYPIGDVNQDGSPDIALSGTWSFQQGDKAAVFIFHSPIQASMTIEDAVATGTVAEFNDVGRLQVRPVGDTNGDGSDDYLVIDSDLDTPGDGNGVAYLIQDHTPLSSDLLGDAASSFLGGVSDADTLGDVDGDGLNDIYIRSVVFSDSGSHHSIHGFTAPFSNVETTDQAEMDLVPPSGYQINDARSGHDIDGDGSTDLVVALGTFPGLWRASLFSGPLLGTIPSSAADFEITGEFEGSRYVEDVFMLGDVSGDGHHDVAFTSGDDGFDLSALGNLYVLYGPVSGTSQASQSDAIIRITGMVDVGELEVAAGDFDGDGRNDIAIGDRVANLSTLRGQIFIYLATTLD
ncbi:MAG: DUF4215 domain-containing protein [Myxococcota bacterium]